MEPSEKSKVYHPADDVYCWLDHSSSIMLRAVSSHGDPVELMSHEARDIAATLLMRAEQLDA